MTHSTAHNNQQCLLLEHIAARITHFDKEPSSRVEPMWESVCSWTQSSCSAGPVAEGAEAVCSAAPCSSQLLSWDGGLEYSGFSSSTLCGGFLFLTNWGRCGGDITTSRHQPYCREVRMQTTVKPLCHPQSVTQNVPVCSAADRRTLQ